MIIFSMVSYPPEQAKEVAKRFLELPQVPDYLTKRGPYFYSTMEEGIVGLSIYELDKSRIAEGKEFIGNYLATYFGVPGFKYEIKTLLDAEEGLKMIGMG
ncbi:MAG: hypothetical protein HUN04_01815 [Desulfobacter sp.]|nr:MAG: hypothetical protein HUN04_01815 [Desulfobacter sp.]